MPEVKQIRALLAVARPIAGSALRAYFRARGDSVEEIAPQPLEALLARVSASRPDIIVLELNSLHTLEELRRSFERVPVVVFAPESPLMAFQAARLGATELLDFPLSDEELATSLDHLTVRLLNPTTGEDQMDRSGGSRQLDTLADFPKLFKSSPRMLEIHDTINKVAATSATVLIRGESGVGKEIVARMIYTLSDRSQRPFIKVNCAAIPGDLLESELFGYDVGAFTGAVRGKPGKFELADTGTLFLDEIGEMEPRLQAKLLHVLQDGQYSRLGAKHDIAVDVRVVCATNQVLEQRVADGRFREDLFYRINVVTVSVPPLRERRDEIRDLIQHFLQKYSVVYRRTLVPFDPAVIQFLCSYHWPGNVRELENLCKRYVIVGDATQIVRELTVHQEEWMASSRPQSADQQPVVETDNPSLLEIGRRAAWLAERAAILAMLVETRWNRREASKRLKVSYKALLNKIRSMDLGTGS